VFSLAPSEPIVDILLLYLSPTRAFSSAPVMSFLVSFLAVFQKRLVINLLIILGLTHFMAH